MIPWTFQKLNLLLIHVFILRNRSALAVNGWVIIHCLELSWTKDQITRASDLSSYNWPTGAWSISILTHNKRRKHIWSLQLHPNFRHCTEELQPMLRLRRISFIVFATSFKRKNDVTRLTPWMTSLSGYKWRQQARISSHFQNCELLLINHTF